MGDIIGIADVFVIVSAPNRLQVRGIVDEIERRLKDEAGARPRSSEGRDDASWVLLDYGDVIIHVFLDETRAFYRLERLWSDAPHIPWQDATAAS